MSGELGADGPDSDDVVIDVEASSATTAGFALVGRVTGAGERAAALAGRRVLAGPADPCGECDVCRRGGASVCPLAKPRERGARVTAAGRWLVALGDGLELPLPAAAAVAGDVSLAYTIYARTGLASHDPAVVVGCSAVARFLVEILRAKAITPTVVADPAHAAWCDWLLGRGAAVARVTATATDGDARAIVAAAIAAQDIGARPWRVIATCTDAMSRAAALAGPRATLTTIAGRAPSPTLPGHLIAREVTIIGVAAPHPDLVVEAAAMCVKGEIDLAGGTTQDPADTTRTLVTPQA